MRQLMDQCRITVEGKDNRRILCEDRIKFTVAQAMRMFCVRLQFKQVDNIHDTNLQLRHSIPKDRGGSQCLQCRCITAACHNKIRLFILVVTCPLPNADTLCTVFYSLLHSKPLAAGMLGCHNGINIVLALDTVIKAGEQTVCIRRQIHADHICLFIGNMI